jgi:hypothetical protein
MRTDQSIGSKDIARTGSQQAERRKGEQPGQVFADAVGHDCVSFLFCAIEQKLIRTAGT